MSSFEQPTLGQANALKCDMAGEVLRLSGRLRLRVMGWSMLPTVWPGDTLVIERVTCDRISTGDIVLFSRDGRFFTHRVVSVAKTENPKNAQIITQGDGMSRPDPPVIPSELLGKVSFLLRNGKCIKPETSPSLSGRAMAALVRRSHSAARILVGVHGMRQTTQEQVAPCQS